VRRRIPVAKLRFPGECIKSRPQIGAKKPARLRLTLPGAGAFFSRVACGCLRRRSQRLVRDSGLCSGGTERISVCVSCLCKVFYGEWCS